MTRRRFSESEVLATLILQGAKIPCYRCKRELFTAVGVEREHLNEVALGGEDTPRNCAYSHEVCHAKVTNGTKATSAGSSKHKIAKDRRLRTGKMAVKPKPRRTPAERKKKKPSTWRQQR